VETEAAAQRGERGGLVISRTRANWVRGRGSMTRRGGDSCGATILAVGCREPVAGTRGVGFGFSRHSVSLISSDRASLAP
jgi:hypothetical protein